MLMLPFREVRMAMIGLIPGLQGWQKFVSGVLQTLGMLFSICIRHASDHPDLCVRYLRGEAMLDVDVAFCG